MDVTLVDRAVELLEKANVDLEPELLPTPVARKLMGAYARAEKLAGFGVTSLSRKVADASEVARATGTSMGKAKATVATGQVMAKSPDLTAAMQTGEVSVDQAAAIASAEESSPGAAADLVPVATSESFHVLKEKARAVKLEAEQHRGLAERQREARSARSYSDELGMVNINLKLEPHVGAPIVARAEAEAQRLARKVKSSAGKANGSTGDHDAVGPEPFERYLADSFAALLSGAGKGRAKRPELVVLVSHEVATRGWTDVKPGEVCKIPGVGPVSPQTAKEIAKDAFLNGVFFDGKDLRHLKRWSRNIPVEVSVALELGDPPEFDGVKCTDCGKRFRNEFDHVEPAAAHGPTCTENLQPRCWTCHREKTTRDRAAGKLTPAPT